MLIGMVLSYISTTDSTTKYPDRDAHEIDLNDPKYSNIHYRRTSLLGSMLLFKEFVEKFEKSIDEVQRVAPYPIDFTDERNLRKQVAEYYKHILTSTEKQKELISEKSNPDTESNTSSRDVSNYGKALELFADGHLVQKAEFIQCWRFGDDLSADTRAYVMNLRNKNELREQELADRKEISEEMVNVGSMSILYGMLMMGMSIDQYYGLGD